ncbi:MAG: FAD-dependent oxidoreductase [Candidatus Eremiobacteraeota bacterium]|nr:FAD-dependent oxidoreductase [Candidatus Eremiobacteraeota bacterium]
MAAARVAVVGAGLAGLSAALDLHEAGYAVDVFERSRLLGGRATSFIVDGHEVDNGQHVFLACCEAFIAFVRRVGMEEALHLEERFDVVAFRRGVGARLRAAALPAPWHLALSFASYRHLSVGARFAVGRALLAVGRATTFEGNFAAWLSAQRQPQESLEAFWEPFVVPALNAPLARVPASEAAFVLQTAFLRDAGAARFGWCTIPLAHIAGAAARPLNAVYLSSGVAGIEAHRDRVVLLFVGGERRRYDAVVLAVPPPQLARMLGDPARFGLPNLHAYEPWPIVDVHYWYEGGKTDFAFAALLESPVQWAFSKGEGYLCCSASAAGEIMTLATEAVAERCWDDVRSTIPSLRDARIVTSAVTRNPYATFLPPPDAIRPSAQTAHPRVTIAGSWTATGWPDTMESAVRSGSTAAQTLTDTLTRIGSV